MGSNNLTTQVNGSIIDASNINDYKTCLSGDFLGRNSSGVPTSGQNLGSATIPWGTGRFQSLIVNGTALDVSSAVAPVNRVVSGQKRSTSNQPAFIKPNGAAASLIIEATSTNLVLDINGSTVNVVADITKTGLTTAPSSNNTALVNDATATGQEATRTWGEYGNSTSITIGTVGTNISNLVGKYAAFKIVGGATTEYFLAYVESATKLSKILRGFFYGPTYNPINRVKFSNGDTITLMSLGWIFVENDGVTSEVSYNPPTWSFTSPTSPATGDYWYNLAINQWERYDGATFQLVSRTIVGMVVLDSTNAVAARSWDFYKNFRLDNDVEVEVLSVTTLQTNHTYQKVSVYGNMIDFAKTLQKWVITTQLAAAADMYNSAEQASTTYYAYIKDTGATVLSDISPHWRGDLLGWYHPHNPWRSVGSGFNNASSNFDSATSGDVPFSEYAAIVSAVPIPGVSTHTTLASAQLATVDGQSIKVLPGTYIENLSMTGRRKWDCSGYDTYLSGTLTWATGANASVVQGGLRISGTVTLNASTHGDLLDVWVATTASIVQSDTSNIYIEAWDESL